MENVYIYEVITTESGYKIIKGTSDDGADLWIPLDPANSDYQEYLAQLEAENN
jgi:hypothetical protein